VKIDHYGRVEITQEEAFTLLYNSESNLDGVFLDDNTAIDQFNQAKKSNADPITGLTTLSKLDTTIEQFDANLQDNWFMPEGYKPTSFDIVTWLLDKCTTDIERNRVIKELELFVKHDMIELLCYLRYLVDTMQENNIVWGVGRGSSVSSYCLYLLGIHRINSIKYNLDISEFLK
jgi:DNA polymerase III alpha subunit